MYNVDINSGFGIPNNFGVSKIKTKIVFDPNKYYFERELLNDRKIYEQLIIVCCEPKALFDIETEILNYGQFFDKILTPYESVNDKFSHSEIYPFGSSWVLTDQNNNLISFIKDYQNNFKVEDKKFKLSFVKSNKMFLPGHKFRSQISHNLNEKYKFDIFFPDTIKPKLNLFQDSMFHLTIENCKQINYFSEKIIDSFMSYTIPIYWGCPNIGDFFDINGVIIINDENDLINTLNNLTEEDYYNKLDSVKKNYEICVNEKYAFFFDRLIEKINN